PSLQEVCQVLGMQEGVLITSCTVDFGSSGAPIFSFSEGRAQIVSVVSAMAEINGKKVSLGTDLDVPLKYLRAELDRAGKSVPQVSGVAAGRGLANSGAKFVRPEE
ncbi:MAG: S1 family peptidase, partial [Roseobacter sp.]